MIILIIVHISLLLNLLRHYHILQLNYYDNRTQWRWLIKHHHKLAPQKLIAILTLTFVFWPNIWSAILLSIAFGLTLIANIPFIKPKKPLVLTSRLLRMLILTYLIIIPYQIWLWHQTFFYQLLSFSSLYILAPLIPIITNVCLQPLEKLFKNLYVNVARNMIFDHRELTTIGVTGSYGKTSVKQYLYELLKIDFDTLVTPESYNTPIGIARTIKHKLRASHQFFVCEMGASKKHEIKELCDIVHPRYGIITAIGQQHLETFGDQRTITSTKFELADYITQNGMLLLNGDNPIIRQHLPQLKCPFLTYGLNQDNDFQARNLQLSSHGTVFHLMRHGKQLATINTPLIGQHSVINLTGAIAMALQLGAPLKSIIRQAKILKPPEHRLQLKKLGQDLIIDDSYNSNPSGCQAALSTLQMFEELKIIITPGMVELGAEEHQLNYQFGQQIALVCDYVFLVGAQQTQAIHSGLIDQKYDSDKIIIVDNFQTAMNQARAIHNDQPKIILIENDLPDNY